jgi:hypothetical protein
VIPTAMAACYIGKTARALRPLPEYMPLIYEGRISMDGGVRVVQVNHRKVKEKSRGVVFRFTTVTWSNSVHFTLSLEEMSSKISQPS